MTEIITKNETETKKIAKELATKLKGGEVIGLIGDLGAGKTVFVKGLARALGVKDAVTSPTFVLMKVYKTNKHQTVANLVHIDAYRLNSARHLEDIGVNEYLNAADSVVIIEWADKVKTANWRKYWEIRILSRKDDTRKILIG